MSDINSYGLIELPLDTAPILETIRVVADPAHAQLLQWLEQVLILDLQDAFDAVKTGTRLDGYVVNQSYPFNPKKWLTLSTNKSFPWLAVWREEVNTTNFGIHQYHHTTDWRFWYILGELNNKEIGRLDAIRQAVYASMASFISTAHHESINDGYNIHVDLNFVDMKIIRGAWEDWEIKEQGVDSTIPLPVMNIKFQTIEINDCATIYPDLDISSITLQSVDENDDATDTEIELELQF